MKAKDLRNSILQMAVQGKLVEQDPNDEPASVLLERIRAERARLIAEKKIRAPKGGESVIYRDARGSYYEKRGDGEPVCIDDEIPFEIPKSWEWVRLESIASVLNGDRGKNYPAKSKLTSKGIPFVSAVNIDNGVVVEDQMLYMTDKQYQALHAGKLKRNDIVFCIRGSLGKFGVFSFEEGAIASSLVIVRPYLGGDVIRRFLTCLFDAPITFASIRSYDNGTAQPNLAAKSLERFLYPIPPVDEQARILKCMSEILPLVDQYGIVESARERLDAEFSDKLRKSVLQYAIQGKLVEQRPEEGAGQELYQQIQAERIALVGAGKLKEGKSLPEIEDDNAPFDIPDNWIWVKLGNLTSKIGAGGTPSGGARAGVYTSGGVPFIREMNVYDEGIRKEGMVFIPQELSDRRENSKFYPGDLLLNITGGSIGRCAVAPPDMPIGDVNQHVEIIRLIDASIKDYIHVLMRSPYVQAIINSRSVGDKAGFSATKCKNIEVPLPPLAEQKRISERLGQILPHIDGRKEDK